MNENYSRFDVRQLQRRVQTMIARGTVRSVDDAFKMQLLNIDGEDDFAPTRIEHWHPYGMTMHPRAGAEVLMLALGGNRDHMVVIGTADRRCRIQNMAGGEVAFHDDQGQKVHFKRDLVLVETEKRVVHKSPKTLIGEDDPNLPRVLTEAGPSNYLRAKVMP